MHSELEKERHPADSAALREKEAMTERYDIFVSYRRKGGSEKAQLVKSEMQLRGIPDERIFLDTHSLHEGDFVSKIKTAVEESKNVVLIVSEGCFDEVRETDFWYMEIKEALAQGKPIIPLFFDGITSMDSLPVPPELAVLKRMNAVAYQHEYAKAAFDKLATFMGMATQSQTPIGTNRQGCLLKYRGCLVSVTLAALMMLVLVPMMRQEDSGAGQEVAANQEVSEGDDSESYSVPPSHGDVVIPDAPQTAKSKPLLAHRQEPRKTSETEPATMKEPVIAGAAKRYDDDFYEHTLSAVGDANEGYEYHVLPIHLNYPAGTLTKKCRLGIFPYVVDCISGDTIRWSEPLYYEGKSYRKRRMRKDKTFDCPVGSQLIRSKEDFVVDTVISIACRPNRLFHIGYRIVAEDYHQQLFQEDHPGTCLLLKTFRFLKPPVVEMDSADVFSDTTILQVREVYDANRLAITQIREGRPDIETLRPYINFRWRLNAKRRQYVQVSDDEWKPGEVIYNRKAVVLNQAVVCLLDHRNDAVEYLMRKVEDSDPEDEDLRRLRHYLMLKGRAFGPMSTQLQSSELLEAINDLLDVADNRAVLYTEVKSLGKRDEAFALTDQMDDDDPSKWYLKAILWADKAGQEDDFNGTPYYLAFLHHSFLLNPDLMNEYQYDAQFSDELRQKYPYVQANGELYESLFQKLKQ